MEFEIKLEKAIKGFIMLWVHGAYYAHGSCFSVNYQLFCEVNMHICTEMTGPSAICHHNFLGLNVLRDSPGGMLTYKVHWIEYKNMFS